MVDRVSGVLKNNMPLHSLPGHNSGSTTFSVSNLGSLILQYIVVIVAVKIMNIKGCERIR